MSSGFLMLATRSAIRRESISLMHSITSLVPTGTGNVMGAPAGITVLSAGNNSGSRLTCERLFQQLVAFTFPFTERGTELHQDATTSHPGDTPQTGLLVQSRAAQGAPQQ